jgi:hypothetical protein
MAWEVREAKGRGGTERSMKLRRGATLIAPRQEGKDGA